MCDYEQDYIESQQRVQALETKVAELLDTIKEKDLVIAQERRALTSLQERSGTW